MFGPKAKVAMDQVFFINSLVFAFVNIKPVLPGHVLVTPCRQVQRVQDLTHDEIFEIFRVGQLIGKIFSKHFKTENFHYTIQDGRDAGQSVPHVHLHILPGKDHEIGKAENSINLLRSLDDMRDEALLYRGLLKDLNL